MCDLLSYATVARSEHRQECIKQHVVLSADQFDGLLDTRCTVCQFSTATEHNATYDDAFSAAVSHTGAAGGFLKQWLPIGHSI